MDEIRSLTNLDGNPLVALDIETTGPEGGYHEIIQIALVPLDINMDPAPGVLPFYVNIAPQYPERCDSNAMRVHGITLDDLLLTGASPSQAAEWLHNYFTGLPLAWGRRMTPLAANWAFERSFLVPWLGNDLLNEYFHHHPRDTMAMGIGLNDQAAMLGHSPPFPYLSLGAMCKRFGIEINGAHDALADTLATAKLYKAMMTSYAR